MNYPVEVHTVKTPDKYLLRIHRLPQEKKITEDKVVLILHGMFCSSIDWVLIGREKSIGEFSVYFLRNAGLTLNLTFQPCSFMTWVMMCGLEIVAGTPTPEPIQN